MKKSMKKVVSCIALLGMLSALGGCAKQETETDLPENNTAEPTIQAESNEPVLEGTIKVWVSSGAEDDIYRNMFDLMETELGITINDEYYPKDELDSKMQVAPVVGDAPDLIVADYLQIPSYYEAGLIAPIDGKLSSDLQSDLLQSVINEATYDNSLVATAQFDSGMAMWANKSMLEDAGIRIPTSYKEAWDKAEFEDALAKLKANGVEFPLYIRQNKPSSLYFTYMPVISSFGGSIMDSSTGLTTGFLDGAGTIAAYDYITWLINQGYINAACDYEDAFYGRKESALALLGHWKYTDHVTSLGDDAIIIPIPDFGNGVYTCSGSTVWSMTTAAADNDVAEEVWAVMEKSLESSYIKTITDFNGAIPSRISVMNEKPELSEGGLLYLYREQLEDGISSMRPLTLAHMTIYTEIQSATADIIAGADAAESLHKAAKAIDEIIVENEWNVQK